MSSGVAITTDAVARLCASDPALSGGAFPPGSVLLAGAGPGGLEHLTLAVVSALGAADAIVYDALVNPLVLRAAPHAELHFVGKRAGQPSARQQDINALLVALARAGKRVLRLKGGDPNVFGRGGEEAQTLLAEGVPFRFLPGLTSGLAGLANFGIPATLRGVSRAIILATGHAADDGADGPDWAALAKVGEPIIIYMGLGNLGRISDQLMAGGLAPDTPLAVIEGATTKHERLLETTLCGAMAAVAAAQMRSPALVVVGDIIAHRFPTLPAYTCYDAPGCDDGEREGKGPEATHD
ncbi:uroporphyrinogen-III C-methyltransferase [Camelimonas abortus]|uniref:uroporphyrinogen-III C-methyltransferase n=1 Tax=Camelimonas abortus TaxID=1017184 RepID=A0ABV7LIU3_9HYPH